MKECPECNLCFDDSHSRCPHDDKSLLSSIACETTLGGRYILERKLGKGGMGSVFKGKHKFLKSSHAIKIISPEVVKSDPTLLVRFHQEAVLAASIHHPNVVSVTDFGVESQDIPFLVMEFIDGISLADFLLKEKRLFPEKAYEVLVPIALGVGAAHSRGITHRDLKPLNVMLKTGYPLTQAVKVLDFGLAKIKSTESFASLVQAKTTNLLGSPHYIPPEQWENEGVDSRSDIYSLGIILFQMLTGKVPFNGNSIPTIMYQHLQVPPPSFTSLGVSALPEIEAVLQKALAKKQDERYATVEELLSGYEDALFKINKQTQLNLSNNINTDFPSDTTTTGNQSSKTESNLGKNFSKTYNLTYLNSAQNETLTSYFNQPKSVESEKSEKLEQEFVNAQNRVEEARSKIDAAEKLALEFNEAQKAAEAARRKVLQAQRKLEEDARRRMQVEMESKLTAEREAREKAEAEASRLLQEVNARKEAEERANELIKNALEAQHRAEEERQKVEKEVQQRQLEEGARRKAEKAALKLAEEVAEAKKKYEEAKKEAEYEAYYRMEAEVQRKKVEEEIQRIAQNEAEKRQIAEAQAAYQIKEQASRLEKQSLEAQKKADQARRLAESEIQKREQAEAARRKAENEALRLAEEIIEAQKQLEEAEQRAKSESEKRALEEAARKKAEESARSLSASRDNLLKNPLSPSSGETLPGLPETSSGQILVTTSSTDVSNTKQIPVRKGFNPVFLLTGLFALFLVSGGGLFLIYYTFLAPDSSNIKNIPSDSDITDSSTQLPVPQLPDRLKNKMVLLKGGTFQMGRSDVDPGRNFSPYNSQYPAHTVEVSGFYIDRTEVSNEEYAEFIQAAKRKPPVNWQEGKLVAGQEKVPVTNVSHSDAKEFAAWITNRDKIRCSLPTEEQWEYAARGGAQQYIYPWGNEWISNRANISSGYPREVGTTDDETSVEGIKDMMGNVMEWTSSTFDYYKDFPLRERGENFKANTYPVVRGVSFAASSKQIENKHLLLTLRQAVESDKKVNYIGFRLTCYP